ncbi:MAG: hypothetical protein AAB263_12265 [Planctomycetota bacterium]
MKFSARGENDVQYVAVSKMDGINDVTITGSLTEIYANTGTGMKGEKQIKDVGSKLFIKGRKMTLEWSRGDANQGYIYTDNPNSVQH